MEVQHIQRERFVCSFSFQILIFVNAIALSKHCFFPTFLKGRESEDVLF